MSAIELCAQHLKWSAAPFHVAIALVGLAQFLGMARASSGNFFNSYPLMTDDSFDWIYEGAVLYLKMLGLAPDPVPYLRNPLFVGVTALDASLGGQGWVVALAVSGALVCTHSIYVWVARTLGLPRGILWAVLAVSLATPLAFVRTWVLPDTLAVAFMQATALGFFGYERRRTPSWLLLAGGAGLLAGYTQTYGLIPLFVSSFVFALFACRRGLREALIPISTGLLVALLYLATALAWRSTMPHEGEPEPLTLLQPTLAMAPFYGHLWAFAFLPLAPLLLAAMWRLSPGRLIASPAAVSLWTSVGLFAALSFFYQWPDARFTYIYFPLLMLALLVTYGHRLPVAPARTWLACISAVGILGESLLLLPGSYWTPAVNSLKVAPRRSWLLQLAAIRPLDRLLLEPRCHSFTCICPETRIPPGLSPYATRIFGAYRELHVRFPDALGGCPTANPPDVRPSMGYDEATPGCLRTRQPERCPGSRPAPAALPAASGARTQATG